MEATLASLSARRHRCLEAGGRLGPLLPGRPHMSPAPWTSFHHHMLDRPDRSAGAAAPVDQTGACHVDA